MKVYYTYDESGYYIKSNQARLSPKDIDDVFLLPARATWIPIPEEVPTDKVPKFDKQNKEWTLVEDPIVLKSRLEKIAKEVDEFGVPKYRLTQNNTIAKLKENEIKELRIARMKGEVHPKYYNLNNKFIELTCVCMTDLSKFTEDNRQALKVFKDNIEQVWNSIDGTKKPEEIIWPEPPEI